MNEDKIHCKIVKGNKVRELLRKIAFEFLQKCDVLRIEDNVPDPVTILNYLDSAADIILGKPGPGDTNERIYSMHPEWTADWNARGFLDTNTERSTMSECEVNPYCWVSCVSSVLISYVEACWELQNLLYENETGGGKRGPVRSRLIREKKPVGRPRKKPELVGPQLPPRPVGRPKKPKTWIYNNGKLKIVTNDSSKSPLNGRGRPKGSKDSPKSNRAITNKLKRRQKRGDFSV